VVTSFARIIESTDDDAIRKVIQPLSEHQNDRSLHIRFQDLNLWTSVASSRIETVWTEFIGMFTCVPKHRYDILKNLSGTLAYGKLTLLLGPPESGKSSFMKLLSGRLHVNGPLVQEGEITYNNETAAEASFILPKLVGYVDQKDIHESVLTVEETLKFAFMCTTGGHHSYGVAKDADSAAEFDKSDGVFAKVRRSEYEYECMTAYLHFC
jgi:ABC-type multidrug transport system fused ATPase/permease subunit